MKNSIAPLSRLVVVCASALLLQGLAGLQAAPPPDVTSATLTVWLDAADPNGDGSIPADGTTVATWVNKALGGIGDFELSSGGTVSPIYLASRSAFNNLPVVHFTAGAGKWLSNPIDLGNNVTVIYAGRKNGTSVGRLVTASFNNWLLGYWGTNMGCSFWGNVGNYQGTSTSDNQTHVWAGSANGTQFFVYRAELSGETQIDTGTLGQGPNGLALGSYNNGAEVGGGDIGELLVYDGALSETDRTSVEAYLASKWIPTTPVYVDEPPRSFTAYVGEFATLKVVANGIAPFSYQWSKDEVEIPSATNATYTFNGALTTNDSGSYTVVVTNSFGSVTSAPAVVTVIEPAAIVDGLAGYWNFDEGFGPALLDYSGNGNDGTLMNFPTDDSEWVAGQVDGALNFRGPSAGSDYVYVPDYPHPSATMTICAWVWADARPQWATIVKNWPTVPTAQFHLGLNDVQGDLSNYLVPQSGIQLGPVREGTGTPLPLGSWQHVALVCDGQAMRLYRNGIQVGTPVAYDGTINTNAALPLGIGAKLGPDGLPPATGDSGYWQGKLDDLGLWTRALSPDEILAIYVAGLNGAPLTDAIVGAVPPAIGTQPQSLTVTEGETAVFEVVAGGTAELNYQWRRDGVNIPDATNHILSLANVCVGDAGGLDVVIRNLAGAVTSAPPAVLTVLPLIETGPITDGLVGHWPFDETTGTTAMDVSFFENHGYLTNFPADNSQWVPGVIGGALNFRGPDFGDYVLVPDYPKPTASLTVSAWVWADARPTWASIVKNWATQVGGEFHFGLNNVEGDLSNYLIQQDGTFVGPVREGVDSPLPLGSWQHVALVCDGTKQQIYRNGVPVGAPLAYDGTINTSLASQALAIGAKVVDTGVPPTTADSGYWQGKMDDIGLWDRGLSSAEIQAIYIAGLQGRDLESASILPALSVVRVEDSLIISWPASPAGACYALEAADTLPPASWTPVSEMRSLTNGTYSVTISTTDAAKFYRLQK